MKGHEIYSMLQYDSLERCGRCESGARPGACQGESGAAGSVPAARSFSRNPHHLSDHFTGGPAYGSIMPARRARRSRWWMRFRLPTIWSSGRRGFAWRRWGGTRESSLSWRRGFRWARGWAEGRRMRRRYCSRCRCWPGDAITLERLRVLAESARERRAVLSDWEERRWVWEKARSLYPLPELPVARGHSGGAGDSCIDPRGLPRAQRKADALPGPNSRISN